MKPIAHIHLVPKSRNGGDISQLPCMPAKHALGTTIPFTLNKLHLLGVDTIPCLQEAQSSPPLSQEPSNLAFDSPQLTSSKPILSHFPSSLGSSADTHHCQAVCVSTIITFKHTLLIFTQLGTDIMTLDTKWPTKT